MKKTLAALAIALVTMFAVPTAASATLAHDPYVPGTPVPEVSNANPTPGGTTSVDFPPGSFAANETVTITVTGVGDFQLASLKSMSAATTTKSITKQAASDGSLTVTITLPTDAQGSYALTAVGATSTATPLTVTLSIVPADAAPNSDDDGLPRTGGEVPYTLIAIAGGVVLLGAAAVVAAAAVRKQRAKQS